LSSSHFLFINQVLQPLLDQSDFGLWRLNAFLGFFLKGVQDVDRVGIARRINCAIGIAV
jgi:hypothetical protein